MVMMPHERKACNPCDVEMQRGLWDSSFHSYQDFQVVAEHLFLARLWVSPWGLSGGQEPPALPLPFSLLRHL